MPNEKKRRDRKTLINGKCINQMHTQEEEEEGLARPPAKRLNSDTLQSSSALMPARQIGEKEVTASASTNSQMPVKQEDIETDYEDDSSDLEDNINRPGSVSSVQETATAISNQLTKIGTLPIIPNQAPLLTVKKCNDEDLNQCNRKVKNEPMIHTGDTLFTNLDQSGPVTSMQIEPMQVNIGLQATSVNGGMAGSLKCNISKIKKEPIDPRCEVLPSSSFSLVSSSVNLDALDRTSLLTSPSLSSETANTLPKSHLLLSSGTNEICRVPPKSYPLFSSESGEIAKKPPKPYPPLSCKGKEIIAKYLHLNLNYSLADVTECLKNLNLKYPSSNNFKLFKQTYKPDFIIPEVHSHPSTSSSSPISLNRPVIPSQRTMVLAPESATGYQHNKSAQQFTNSSSPIKLLGVPNFPLTSPKSTVQFSPSSTPSHPFIKSVPQLNGLSAKSRVEPSTTELKKIMEQASTVRTVHSENKRKLSPESLSPVKKLKEESYNSITENPFIDNRKDDSMKFTAVRPTSSANTIKLPCDDIKSIASTSAKEHVHSSANPRDPRLERPTPSANTITLPSDPRQRAAPSTSALSARQDHLVNSESPRDPRLRKGLSRMNSCRSSTVIANQSLPTMKSPSSEIAKYTNYPAGDIVFHIIKWDTKCLSKAEYPEMLKQFLKQYTIKDTYRSEFEYASTYFGLHLLNTWCDISSSWKSNPKKYQCQLDDIEEKNTYFKNTCIVIVSMSNLPIQQSLILVTYTTVDGHKQCLFGLVYDVKHRPYNPLGLEAGETNLKDVKFCFYTDKKIQIPKKSTITIQTLCRVRVALKQYESLVFGQSSDLRSVVMNPACNLNKLKTIVVPSTTENSRFSFKEFEPYVDDISNSAKLSNNLITMVQTPPRKDTWLIILALINRFFPSPILICVSDVEKLHSIAKKISIADTEYNVLAVKESEVDVQEDIQECTLRSRAANLHPNLVTSRAEMNVLRNSKIILTVLSHMFLGETRTLSPETICIVDNAHLASEAETALVIDLKPKRVVLIGVATDTPELDPSLHQLGYHKTLFHRLCKYSK